MADFKPIRCLKYAPQLKRSIIVKSVMAFLLLCGTLDNCSREREELQVAQFPDVEQVSGWFLWQPQGV